MTVDCSDHGVMSIEISGHQLSSSSCKYVRFVQKYQNLSDFLRKLMYTSITHHSSLQREERKLSIGEHGSDIVRRHSEMGKQEIY